MGIISIVAVFLTTSVIVLMAANRPNEVFSEHFGAETVLLRLPKVFRWIGAAFTGSGAALIMGIALGGVDSIHIVKALLVFLGVLFAAGGVIVAYVTSKWRVELHAGDQYFFYTTFFGRTHGFSFADISGYQMRPLGMVYYVYGKGYFVNSQAIHFDLLVQSFEMSGVTLQAQSKTHIIS